MSNFVCATSCNVRYGVLIVDFIVCAWQLDLKAGSSEFAPRVWMRCPATCCTTWIVRFLTVAQRISIAAIAMKPWHNINGAYHPSSHFSPMVSRSVLHDACVVAPYFSSVVSAVVLFTGTRIFLSVSKYSANVWLSLCGQWVGPFYS